MPRCGHTTQRGVDGVAQLVVPLDHEQCEQRVAVRDVEVAELAHQFTGPWVVDSSRSEERLGLRPTPFEDAVRATVDWWREQDSPVA